VRSSDTQAATSICNAAGATPLAFPNADDSLVIVEHSSKETIRKNFGPLQEFDGRNYGDTAVAFYTLNRGTMTRKIACHPGHSTLSPSATWISSTEL
jgi:hypothetical protein